MTAKIFLRIASVLIFVHLLGHSIGHFTWDSPEDRNLREVVTVMKAHKAEFMGATKSMADYYVGYSLIMFGLFAMSIILLWIISNFIHEQRKIANMLLYPIGLAYLAFGVIEYIHFFPFAAIISLTAGLLVILSASALKR